MLGLLPLLRDLPPLSLQQDLPHEHPHGAAASHQCTGSSEAPAPLGAQLPACHQRRRQMMFCFVSSSHCAFVKAGKWQQLPPCLGDGVGGTSIWGKRELIWTKHKPTEAETQTQLASSDLILFQSTSVEQKHETSTDTKVVLYGIFTRTKIRKVAKVLQESTCSLF